MHIGHLWNTLFRRLIKAHQVEWLTMRKNPLGREFTNNDYVRNQQPAMAKYLPKPRVRHCGRSDRIYEYLSVPPMSC
jgi:hypothetical protein